MSERKVPVKLPSGQMGEGIEIEVDESTERWSEFKLNDGTIVRMKVTVTSAVRVPNEFDQFGNPLYIANFTPVVTVNAPDQLRKKMQ